MPFKMIQRQIRYLPIDSHTETMYKIAESYNAVCRKYPQWYHS